MAKDEGFFIEIWVVLKKRDEKKKKKKKKKRLLISGPAMVMLRRHRSFPLLTCNSLTVESVLC